MTMAPADARRALVLFSGGQDSTACLAWALDRFAQVETVVAHDPLHRARIGQLKGDHDFRIEMARKTELVGIDDRVVRIAGLDPVERVGLFGRARAALELRRRRRG